MVVVLVVVVVSGDVGSGIDSGPSPGEHDAASTAPADRDPRPAHEGVEADHRR